jgi:hypothetical protein
MDPRSRTIYRATNHRRSIAALLHWCPYICSRVPLVREHDLLSVAWLLGIASMTVWSHAVGAALSHAVQQRCGILAPRLPTKMLRLEPRIETPLFCGVPRFLSFSLLDENSSDNVHTLLVRDMLWRSLPTQRDCNRQPSYTIQSSTLGTGDTHRQRQRINPRRPELSAIRPTDMILNIRTSLAR